MVATKNRPMKSSETRNVQRRYCKEGVNKWQEKRERNFEKYKNRNRVCKCKGSLKRQIEDVERREDNTIDVTYVVIVKKKKPYVKELK